MRIHETVWDVNHATGNRLRRHVEHDANVNALAVLNCMSQYTALSLEDGLLDEIDTLFQAYLR